MNNRYLLMARMMKDHCKKHWGGKGTCYNCKLKTECCDLFPWNALLNVDTLELAEMLRYAEEEDLRNDW